ncbi:thioredoxin domain-containing protein [Planctomycetota bacterium]
MKYVERNCRLLTVGALCVALAASHADEPHADEPHADQAEAGVKPKHTNRLAKESSLYLRMHAHNPVDWYPWGEEAFAKAKKENKVVFLSVGYSSCYWCHVMERESFMDEEIAEFLNTNFVCIKVDREERPDVDEIYMLTAQIVSGSGGWPMTVFMQPDAKPFFGGTYFPARDGDRPGSRGFLQLAKAISQGWTSSQPQLKANADEITKRIRQALSEPPVAEPISDSLFVSVRNAFSSSFDSRYGGFVQNPSAPPPNRPKFPEPSNLLFLNDLASQDDVGANEMFITTLERMHMGGIWDHIGGGFHRYSTDRFWRIPHFEKMLYDNGQLLTVYSEAFERTKRSDFRRVIERTAAYMNRELKAPGGAFFAAMDAESEKVEGKFYRWTPDEIRTILKDDYDFYAKIYGLNGPPNFEEHFHVPLLQSTLLDVAKANGLSEVQLYAKLDALNAKLLKARSKRPRPVTDNKILASWNGLAIRGLADAGRTLNNSDLVKSATDAADFVLRELRAPDGRMRRTYTDGKASLNGYLDDYAFLVNGLIALHRATGDDKWLKVAAEMTEKQIELFWDQKNGSFFFTSADHESLIARTKTFSDNVQPAGNTVAAENLVYLANALNKPDYESKAKAIAESGASFMKRVPRYAPRLLLLSRGFMTP